MGGLLPAFDLLVETLGNRAASDDNVLSMIRSVAALVFLLVITSGGQPRPTVLSVCELSKDYGAYRDKVVTVRGIYYYGLRQICEQKCAEGPWPSFIELRGTQSDTFDAVDKVQQAVELKAKKGKRLEIWVTATGQLETMARLSPNGPCDKKGSMYMGYGHLGGYPAQLTVRYFSDIEVKENPKSPYDYSHMYRGAL